MSVIVLKILPLYLVVVLFSAVLDVGLNQPGNSSIYILCMLPETANCSVEHVIDDTINQTNARVDILADYHLEKRIVKLNESCNTNLNLFAMLMQCSIMKYQYLE